MNKSIQIYPLKASMICSHPSDFKSEIGKYIKYCCEIDKVCVCV